MKKATIFNIVALAVFLFGCSSKTEVFYVEPPKEEAKKDRLKEKSLYEKQIEERLKALLRAPKTPMRTPDTILRVLVLPYAAMDGSLVMSHYVFVKVDDGKWILGEYLLEWQAPSSRTFTPLKTEDGSGSGVKLEEKKDKREE